MNIFANLHIPKRQREVVFLFNEDFSDYQLLREKIHQFRYDNEDIVFIRYTKLMKDTQEQFLDDFLRKELGTKYNSRNYKPSKHYVHNGQPCVTKYHQNLECYIFTSDHTEQDISDLNESTKKLGGFTFIERRPTTQEIKERIKKEKKNAIKDKFSNIGALLGVIVFFAFIVLGCIYIDERKEFLSVIGVIIGIVVILFILFVVWRFVSDRTRSKWIAALKTIGITILILAALFLIGYLIPDIGSNYVNDAHRPDRLR